MSHSAFPGGLSPEDPGLTERQRAVFRALVLMHGHTAHPVGSEALAGTAGIRTSPASVRGDLAALEQAGLLVRAHSSSGRVPTARGYAFYVRALLAPAALPPGLEDEIVGTLAHSTRDVEDLLHEASRLLSALTHQLGLAVASAFDDMRLQGLDLAPLAERRALLALDLGGGAAHTLVLTLESPLEPGALEEVGAVLRERLLGRSLSEVRARLAGDPELVRDSAVRVVAAAAAASWARLVSTPIFTSGAGHIAELPEFSGPGRIAPILRVVEEGAPLDRLMVAGVEGQVAVRVGLDEDDALVGCSLVSYPLPGKVRAAVGVLGPLRMDYALAFAVVDAVGTRVSEAMRD